MLSHKDFYVSSYLAGVSWLLYAYFFVIAKDPLLSSLFLTLGGLFAVKVFIVNPLWYLWLGRIFQKNAVN